LRPAHSRNQLRYRIEKKVISDARVREKRMRQPAVELRLGETKTLIEITPARTG
jgi:hypothetical protein